MQSRDVFTIHVVVLVEAVCARPFHENGRVWPELLEERFNERCAELPAYRGTPHTDPARTHPSSGNVFKTLINHDNRINPVLHQPAGQKTC
jgi:hypothetical protein